MPKKKNETIQVKRCVFCGKRFNLIQQENDIWKCTTCLADDDERQRHGLPLKSLEPAINEKVEKEE